MKIKPKYIPAIAIFFIVLGSFFYKVYQKYAWYVDCSKDHSETFNEIGKPMVSNVLAFYKENQRYPSLEESEVLMEKAGCINVKQREYKNEKNEIYERWASYECNYKSATYGYGLSIGYLNIDHSVGIDAYSFGFSKGETRCSSSFHEDGREIGEFGCYQGSCLLRNLSH